MLLYLVRHGETDLNAQGVYQGHLPTPLNEAGRKQAGRLSEYLRGVPFKQCWSSHLPRAAETAKIVLGPYHPKTNIQLDPLLTDRAMGALEGKSWLNNEDLAVEEGVESDEALAARLNTFLSQLIQTHTPIASPLNSPRAPATPLDQGAGCVLVVTHEACILALLQLLTDTPASAYFPERDEIPVLFDDAEKGEAMMLADMSISSPAAIQEPDNSEKKSTLPCIVETHIPADVDVGLQCANTALCIIRVWWEEGRAGNYLTKGMEAKGRIEVWCEVGHLDE